MRANTVIDKQMTSLHGRVFVPQCGVFCASIDVFHKWRLWHGNEARMLFSRSILVSNYQTDMFLCFIFAKIAK